MALVNFKEWRKKNRNFSFSFGRKKRNFIPLGKIDNLEKPDIKNLLNKSIEDSGEVWATLGYENDEIIDFEGEIQFSEYGNDHSIGAVKKDIEILKELYEINDGDPRVIEQYIDFRKIEIPKLVNTSNYDDIPLLRLTLILAEDEDAIVEMQYLDSDNVDETDSEIEYLSSEEDKTTNRKTYILPFIHQFSSELLESSGGKDSIKSLSTKSNVRPVLKILRFKKSKEKLPKNIAKEVMLKLIAKWTAVKVPFLIYNNNEQNPQFSEIKPNDLDLNKKTLWLLHGTFSSLKGSFDDLYSDVNWIHRFMNAPNEPYEQVIGFEYDSWSISPIKNAQFFKNAFANQAFDGSKHTFITTSQGGLVAKGILSRCPDSNKETPFKYAKCISIAFANYSGYLEIKDKKKGKKGRAASLFMNLLKSQAPQSIKIILTVLNYGYDLLISLEALQGMRRDTIIYNQINALHVDPTCKFELIAGEERAKYASMRLINNAANRLFVNKILEREHDWTISCKAQKIISNCPKKEIIKWNGKEHVFVRFHTKYLSKDGTSLGTKYTTEVPNRILKLLN